MAARSKISYLSNNSPGGHKYFPQPMCGGVALFDFDNDGRLDIFFTNGAQLPEMKKTNPSYYNCLLRQRADGGFDDVTIKAALTGKDLDFNFGAAVGDYDNDGYEDLFICSAGRNALYHNNGDGTFTDVTAASGIGGKPPDTLSVAAAWFDYDNDGLLDLIVDNLPYGRHRQTYAAPWVVQNTTAIRDATRACHCASIAIWATASSRTSQPSRVWVRRRARGWVSPSRISITTDGLMSLSPMTPSPIRYS